MNNPTIRATLGELAGSASLCWEPKPDGVFDPKQAEKFIAEAEKAILADRDKVVEQVIGKDESMNPSDYGSLSFGERGTARTARLTRNEHRADQRNTYKRIKGES